jgi:hypothetical protein
MYMQFLSWDIITEYGEMFLLICCCDLYDRLQLVMRLAQSFETVSTWRRSDI